MELDQATEQFYEKLSERLKEKGFSTRDVYKRQDLVILQRQQAVDRIHSHFRVHV